jgi:hypothetical protein
MQPDQVELQKQQTYIITGHSLVRVCMYVQVALFLKDSWISTLRAAIRTSLRDVGRGWFNLHESNWEVYQISKLKKFMEMVKFNMQVCHILCLLK